MRERIARDHAGQLVRVTVNGETIEATGEHPFWVVSGNALSTRLVSISDADVAIEDPSSRWVAEGAGS